MWQSVEVVCVCGGEGDAQYLQLVINFDKLFNYLPANKLKALT